MNKRVSSTVTKRKANPRPRKYASASERQAAYRARAPEVCFRAEPKTVETLDRIADTLDQSRADVLLSMTKFALANHDWARFGLTHKPLPFEYGVNPLKKMTKRQEVIEFGKRMGFKASAGKGFVYLTNMVGWGETFDDWDQAHAYLLKAYDDHYVNRTPYPWDYKENPMKTTRAKRKPTPAQLAARQRFAEMARSGAFAKGRKRNPAGSGPVKMKIRGSETPDNPEGLIVTEAGALRWAKQNMPKDLKRAGFVPSVVAGARGWSINYGAAVPGHSTYSRKTNPARKAAGVRRNPASTAPFKFVCIAPLEYSGSKYGIDERTPVTLKFAKIEPAASTVYACYQLPASVVKNDDFQNFAYHNKVLYMSIAQLRAVLKGYAK